MNAIDLIYNETYKGCLKAGCDESLAKNTALSVIRKYKNNQFVTTSKLISQSITEAKKLIVKKKKANR